MKHIFKLFIATIILSFLFTPVTSYGLNLGKDLIQKAGVEAGYDEATDEYSFSENIGRVVNAILSITGVIFTVLMVYGGYLWMTARGKDEQIEKAKSVITASIIGLIITLGAYSISAFVVPRMLASSVADVSN